MMLAGRVSTTSSMCCQWRSGLCSSTCARCDCLEQGRSAGGRGGSLLKNAGGSLRQMCSKRSKKIMSRDMISGFNIADQGETISVRGASEDGLLLLLLWCIYVRAWAAEIVALHSCR
jgi:hypothetical protein